MILGGYSARKFEARVGFYSHSRRDRTDLVGAQRFLNLIAGNRLVFTHANPGRDYQAD